MPVNFNSGTRMYYIRRSDGLAYCFSPVPFMSEDVESTSLIIDGEQRRIATTKTFTFEGTLLPDLPELSGVNSEATCLELLDRKSDQLKSALDEDYGNLLIVDASGYAVLSEHVRVDSINFDLSQIVTKRDYTVAFSTEHYSDADARISTFSDTWAFQQQDDDTVTVTHSISAVGINDIGAPTGALENAKDFVLSRSNTIDKTLSFFIKSPYTSSILDVDNLFEFNHTRSENSDTTAGSYSIDESWVLSSGNYKDDRTIESSWELTGSGILQLSTAVNGTVQGYGDDTFSRLDNAITAFEDIVAPQISFYSTTGILSKSRSDNRFAGTVTYSVDYGVDQQDPLQDRTITRSLTRNDDGSVTQSVTTSARVSLSSPSGIEHAINYCVENNYPIDSYIEPYFSSSYSGNIESVSAERDDLQKSFSLTKAYRDQSVSGYWEEWQSSREQSIETATVTISINGSVYGLSPESSTSSTDRFTNASGAFYNTIMPLIRGRAEDLIPSGSCLGINPISTTIGYNKRGGIVTYDYRYDNRYLSDNPLISDEVIEVDYQLPGQVIAIIPIPLKSTGPILQDQGTVTQREKRLRIQYSMTPSGITCGPISTATQYQLELAALSESDILVNNTMLEHSRGEKPIASGVFKTADQYTFNKRTLVFTRNVSWTHTQT